MLHFSTSSVQSGLHVKLSVLRKYFKVLKRVIRETAAVWFARKEYHDAEQVYKLHRTEKNRARCSRSLKPLKASDKKEANLEFEQCVATKPDNKVFRKYVHSKHRPHSPVGPLCNPHTSHVIDDARECTGFMAECYADNFTVKNPNMPSSPLLTFYNICEIYTSNVVKPSQE